MSDEELTGYPNAEGPAAGQQPMDMPAPGPGPAASEPQGGAPSPYGAPKQSTPANWGQTPPATGVSDDDRLMAALSWLCAVILQFPLVSLVLLLAEPNRSRPFQRYHAVASMAFWVAAIVYEMVAAVVYVILGFVTLFVGFACLWPIFFLPHVLALYYAYTAFTGQQPQIPVISDLLRRQGWA